MKLLFKNMGNFMGTVTNVDPTRMPLGGAVSSKNVMQYFLGRIQRIPGVTTIGTTTTDGSVQIPFLQILKEVGGPGSASQTVAVYIGASNVVKLVNTNTITGVGTAMTGPALTGAFNQYWSYTFYAQQHLIVGKGNVIQQITNNTTYAAMPFTGSLTAGPEIILSFLDRLYVVDNTNSEGLVQYSDNLTNNFQALNVVNTREVPGPITALGIYVPSTGTMGIRSGLLIFKKNAIWVWDESSKDIVSQKVGTLSPNTVRNSPAGVLFLGEKSNVLSVFLIPPGLAGYGLYHFGEPIDVGKALFAHLNVIFGMIWWADTIGGTLMTWNSGALTWTSSSGITNPSIAHGTIDGKFYKLFFATGQNSQNNEEFWLDLDILTQNPGETREGREPQAIWYGPHTRGSFDASTAGEDISKSILIARRGAVSAPTLFQENIDATQNFTDADGNVLPVFIDLPMNVEPDEVEKFFGRVQFHIAGESHVLGNQLSVTALIDGDIGLTTILTVTETDISHVHIEAPIFGLGRIGASGHHPRFQLSHVLNQRLDIIGTTFEYNVMERERIVPNIRA